jgi:hypothetical protein
MFPFDEQYGLMTCANGYLVLYRAYEGGNANKQYFLDSKLVAIFSGYWTAPCVAGPPDFVEPECIITHYTDFCAKGDASAAFTSPE